LSSSYIYGEDGSLAPDSERARRTGSTFAKAEPSGQRGAAHAHRSATVGRHVLPRHRRETRGGTLYRLALEAALRKGRCVGLGDDPSGPAAAEAHAAVSRQGSATHSASATGRFHALVAPQNGGGDEGQQEPDRAHLARGGFEAAPVGALPGFQRSAV